ncbi:MFS transporter [Halocynthiibacter sp. C4]|uniref:MFS transporter n=1 Tax=Halocynthiibacter sp. C4 TaxID=2992758 RepID=UPI00237AB74C|nr:MFS transporter [Halocynthiibacter sp. C4]MDE0589109.1 MFS transporter [Halocynthiibacter sp. C4]
MTNPDMRDTAKKDAEQPQDQGSQFAARNKVIHIISLSATKTADALIDPKLVLSWLMNALGAPAYLVGALVPIREAGALLPQLLVARIVGQSTRRKQFWSFGAAIQGAMAIAIGLSAYLLDGVTAGWAIILALGVLAVGRSIASTTYKDALARSVAQGERGAVKGAAGSIAAALGLAYGASFALGVYGGVSQTIVANFILLAGTLFIAAAFLFLSLQEGEFEPKSNSRKSLQDFFAPLLEDRELQVFILARALLTSTALAPPFIVMATIGTSENSLTDLGPLVVASSLAAVVSAYGWGKISDKSSRLSLILAGAGAALVYALIVFYSVSISDEMNLWLAGLFMFGAQVCYQGVRSGRSIYLTDATSDDSRLDYTALSNTVIGCVLVAGLGLGAIAHFAGPNAALLLCAILSAAGALAATRLSPVAEKAELE